ncbi:ABC transporter permease [Chitinophaga vietnamensis]|uniref:ABC transporter permease n=1 Tax=Chitinophaga vietnamensis TaxID=2593957 RepID=UPI001177590B|nr:ABC transporter permease [Chitinophaga vietnamensis]
MIRNYLLVAIRNIWRNKAFSVLNILGLVVGISAALVMALVVYYESSFNKGVPDSDRVCRLASNIHFSGDSVHNAGVAVPMAATIRQDLPQAETVAQFFVDDFTSHIVVTGDHNVPRELRPEENDIAYVDSSYFRIFPYQWVAGKPETALQQPFSAVLTENRAATYFPGMAPYAIVGREMVIDDSIRVTVTGIVKDMPGQTDFRFGMFQSIATIYSTGLKNLYNVTEWNNVNSASQTLLKMKTGTSIAEMDARLNFLFDQHVKKDANTFTRLKLQPLTALHFDDDYGTFNRTANKKSLFIQSMVALALLLLAVINFINLNTAQAGQRARETGVRKTMGSTVPQLVAMFMGETLVVTLIASLCSLVIAPLLIINFRSFLPANLPVMQLFTWPVLLFLLVLSVLTAVLCGIYPALVLSRFQPVAVLKTQVDSTGGKAWLRKTLTVSQFAVAQFFIIATIVVSKQIDFAIHKDMGFRKDAIVMVRTPFMDGDLVKRKALQQQISAIPEVAMVSLASQLPAFSGSVSTVFMYKDGKKEISKNIQMRYGDSAFIPLFKLQLVAGRNLVSSDTAREWVLNEMAVKGFGFHDPKDIIGVTINNHPVVGVVKDFNTGSMRGAIPELAIASDGLNQHRRLMIQLQAPGTNGVVWKTALEKIEKAWKNVYPKETFSSVFLDKSIEAMYYEEQHTGTLLRWCAGLAFFISALGLLGLVIFTTNQRRREIGIRKVLGATVWQMITLLTKDFMRLVIIAFILAIPVAWYVMYHWLMGYAYRTTLSWWVFAVGGLGMAALALVVMSLKTIRAALSNPVQSLRTE